MTAPPSPHPDDALHFARELADILGEKPDGRGYRDILRVARVVGLPATKLAARETLKVLDADGLPTLDGARRRTPGGVFLRLVFEACSSRERRMLFGRGATVPKVFQSRAAFRERFAELVRDHRRRVAAEGQTRGATATDAPRGRRGKPGGARRRSGDAPPPADRRRASGDKRRPPPAGGGGRGDRRASGNRRRAPDPPDD